MTNPRFALLLANYALHDRITLALAGVALAAVLIGWAMTAKPPRSRWDRLSSNIYFGFLVLAFVLTLAGSCAYLILTGGYA
jgi:hypothetical protein